VLYRKRNVDLLVNHFALKRNLVTGKCWLGNRDYMVNFQRDAGIPASRAEIFSYHREVDSPVMQISQCLQNTAS